jgi:hypothetical protein
MVLVVVTVSFITFQLITKQASWEKMLKNVCEITSETFKVIVQNEKKMKGNFILNIINEGEEWKRRFLFYFFYIHKNSLWLFFGCSEDFNKFFLTSKKEKNSIFYQISTEKVSGFILTLFLFLIPTWYSSIYGINE